MNKNSMRLGISLLAGLFLSGTFVIDSNAQTRNRRPRRASRPVVTNPPIAPSEEEANSDDPKIVSTADENGEEVSTDANTTAKTPSKKKAQSEKEMQDTINNLSNQVERLSDKLSEMQQTDRTLVEMERLTRAEQRAEGLRTQLFDVETKLAGLQGKVEEIEYSLRPEILERSMAGYGSTRPEDLREARRRQLEGERARVQSQVRLLETSKSRLEQALVTADAEVDRLRRRLELLEQQAEGSSREKDSGTQKP